MKKLLLLLLTSYTLMADALPETITTSIKNINSNNTITLANSVPAGMSGIVVHDYGNGLISITNTLITEKNGKATLLPYTAIKHENIPNIKTKSKVNDKVILGNFYHNVLIIAPNVKIYNNISKKFKRNWVHPDRFAVDFMKNKQDRITFKNLEKFSKKNQVGLVLIVAKDRLLIVDPISKKFIGSRAINLSVDKTINPFYARFEQIDTSTFGFSKVTLTDYYKAVEALEQKSHKL